MKITKPVVSIILVISLAFSFIMGAVPAYATELNEECCDTGIVDPESTIDLPEECCNTGIVHPVNAINTIAATDEYFNNEEDGSTDPIDPTDPENPADPTETTDELFDIMAAPPDMTVSDDATILSSYDAIEQFVARLYLLVLGRPHDPEGLQNWSNTLRNKQQTGASIANEFFFSREFKLRNVDNGVFVDIIYRTLLNRYPDPVGRADWTGVLDDGVPRENVFAGFVHSLEFEIMCRQAGIEIGTYRPPQFAMHSVFVARLYRTILERPPDPRGLNDWTEALRSGVVTGASIAYEFVFSPEMSFRNLSDAHFIDVLYESMLGRRADPGGRADWVGVLRSGVSRYNVFVGFVNSVEFGLICDSYGIIRGTPPPHRDMMTNSSNSARIWNLIVDANFRGISDRPEHIAGIIGNLMSEAGTNLCPFQIQVSNHRGLGLMQWTDPTATGGRRTELENYMWRSGVTPEEFFTEMNRHLDRTCNPSNPNHHHPPELFDRVTRIQINFMFHELSNTWERQYMNYIDFPADKSGTAGARAYAELFCALALRPGDGGPDNMILDPGVLLAMQASPWPTRNSFSALATRRNRAENVLREFLTNSR